MNRKLAYLHRYQTRARGFDEPQNRLLVVKEEEDSDTEASGSWAAAIPRYENHEVGPRIDVWAEENTMSSLSMDRGGRKLFNGDRDGPPLRHLKQMAAAQDVALKLRPQAANLTPNDHFILYTELLEGGARSQADQLQERMQKELDMRNAIELAEYDSAVTLHPARLAEWNALPPAGRGPVPVPPPQVPPVAGIAWRDPLGQFWELFNRLYPERSSSRIEEYRDFKALSGESTPNLVNRLDLLHVSIGGPELQAVTKLLDALRKDLRTEVQQKLSARYPSTGQWTVRRAGDIAEEIERNAAELSLYTGRAAGPAGSNNNAPGKSGNAAPPRSDQRTCHQCNKVGHIKRDCPQLQSGAIVNARYANAPAQQKGVDLANVECYTCHKKGHYSNKCPQRQPGTALGTPQDGKPWCSHHQANTHSSEECWYLHPHLKDQAGGRQGKKKQQTNARRAEAADGGGSGGPSGTQLQELFAAFMQTQNQPAPGPRREDSYSGSVVELKVPITPMSDTDQPRIRAGATPWRSKTLEARVAATTLTRKGPERQRLAGPQSKMPLGFLQQGPLTSRLRGGERKMLKNRTTRRRRFQNLATFAPRRDTCGRIAQSAWEGNPLRSLRKMLRQSAKEQVSLKGPRRD